MIVIAREGLQGEVRAAETAAFERLYARTWPDVFRYVWILVRHREDAEDIAADTFRRAYEAWQAGRGPESNELAWLFLIARRTVIDRSRRRRLVRWLPLAAGADEASPAEEAAFRRSEVWIWFDGLAGALPARQREALLLRYEFDLPDEATARLMGVSVQNVRTLISRALATIRKQPEVLDL